MRWGKAHLRRNPEASSLLEVMAPLVGFIAFHKINTAALMKIVKPSGRLKTACP